MLKLWDRANRFIQQESGMFAGKDEVKLLFPAEKIFRVYTPATGVEFYEGRDFEYLPEKTCLKLLPSSRIPYFSPEKLHPNEDVPCFPHPEARAVKGAVDGSRLLFDNRSYFAENQIVIDYRAEYVDFDPELPAQLEKLPLFRKKLAAPNSDIRLTLIGDSISEGFNATSFTHSEPFAPAYIDQVVRYLTDRYRVDIQHFNRSVEGVGCLYALQNFEQWVHDSPDLLIISFGMNDYGRRNAPEYKDNLRKIIAKMREYSPACEVVLVDTMTGNPNWTPTLPGIDVEYSAKLHEIVDPADNSIAVADVQKVWKMLLERKDFYDLSGNGVNHPNDYGHRVYASVLIQLLSGVNMF